MKAKVLKKDVRIRYSNDRYLGIQQYGEGNDYPQEVQDIIAASSTGLACLSVYHKFVAGQGISDELLYRKVVNSKGQTLDYVLNQAAKDKAAHGGYYLHYNYNANFRVVEIQNIPFETVRFEKMDEQGYFDRVAIHPDWGRRFTSLRRWRKDDIEFIDMFNPDPAIIQEQVDKAGSWQFYKGQVFCSEGKTYPLPIFDSVLTDMNTEEGISNVNNRNARNNFLTSGMLVNIVSNNNSILPNEREGHYRDDGSACGRMGEDSVADQFKVFQGDENACKIMYVEVESKDDVPEFTPFSGKNYDKEFEITNKTVESKIGKAFSQPPILRAEDVGSNFGAEAMRNAYNFYNSITVNERQAIERDFTQVLKIWHEPIEEFVIYPLSYNVKTNIYEMIGEKGFADLMKVIDSTVMSPEHKRNMAKRLFDFSEEELNDLIPTT